MNDSIESRIVHLLAQNERVVLVTIIDSQGSAPRHAGTRALHTSLGFEGTIGGGILEAHAKDLAKTCFETRISRRARFTLLPNTASDMVCGGAIEVLCELLDPSQHDLFAQAAKALAEGRKGLWRVTIKQKNETIAVDRSLLLAPNVPPTKRPHLERSENMDCYDEPLIPPSILLLCGGGHVALEVAQIAARCDFIVDVVDDRAEFANAQRFPCARACYVAPQYANIRSLCHIGPHHYVAIMTRGHAYDQTVLEQILEEPVTYVGMIGSTTKRDTLYASLKNKGVSQARINQVFCPIGLPIFSETPQQIAVSVCAQLLAVKGQL